MRFFLLILLLTGCAAPPAPRPERLNISFHSMPQTADPGKCGDFLSATLICMIFEGLTRSASDGSVDFALAKSVEISEDGLTYLFHLRPSFWSDGTLVTAHDFVKSWKRAIHPDSLSSYLFYPIKNAEKACKGDCGYDEIGLRALSDNALEVILDQKTDYFLSLTAFPSYLPAPSHAAIEISNEPSAFVSNGPFLLDSINTHSHLLLKKNSLYWNSRAISLDEIQISIISNEATAMRMFSQGELDCLGASISPILPDSIKSLKDKFPLQKFPMGATTFVALKNDHPYLKCRQLRQALALAVNRRELIERITQMEETPAASFIPPSLLSNQIRELYPLFDPIAAREHFALALQELRIAPEEISLTLSYSASELNTRLAQALQTHWKEVLGLNIELDAKEAHCFKELLYHREFDLALAFWIAQFLDPINILERLEDPKNWKNYSGWDHAGFREKIRLVRQGNERMRQIEDAEEILASEMPLIPLYHWSNLVLCNPRVQNLQVNPNGAILFEKATIPHPPQ